MSRPPKLIARLLVHGAWRRRYHLILSLLAMLIAGVAAANLLPQSYQVTSLMLLQESSKTNPFEKDLNGEAQNRMRERITGLEALLKSERVLGKALNDWGNGRPLSGHQRATELSDLRKALSLDLLGNDFLEFRLKGKSSHGLGQRLETITGRFLEALLPDQNAVNAAQILIANRKAELEAASQADMALKAKLRTILPGGDAAALQDISALGLQISQAKSNVLSIDGDLAELARGLNMDVLYGGTLSRLIADREAAKQRAQPASSTTELVGKTSAYSKASALEARRAKAAEELESLQGQQDTLQASLDTYRLTQAKIAEADRTLAAARDTYTDYAKHYATLNANSAVSILNAPERIVLIDPAKDPDAPITPSFMYIVGGLLSGLALGVLLATLAELADSRIRYPHEVFAATGLPVLGVLPNVDLPGLNARNARGGAMVRHIVLVVVMIAVFLFGLDLLFGSRPSRAFQNQAITLFPLSRSGAP
jgi:uncharacterized protein involved in exopolysaccharide biosynthesis